MNLETDNVHAKVAALREISIRKVNENMAVLEKQVWDLPASIIRDILPHLNIFYLERIEPVAKCKGVSTGAVWATLWKDLGKAWCCRSKNTDSAEEWRYKCLERLFHLALFGYIRLDRHYVSNLSWSSILSLTAKHVRVLSLFGSAGEICKLASDELRPILATLESNVRCIKLQDTSALFKQGHSVMLYIFHRLLDHGSVRDLVLTRSPDTKLLTWILQHDSRSQCTLPQADTRHLGMAERKTTCLHGESASSHGACFLPEHKISGAVSIRCRDMDNDLGSTPFKRPKLDVGHMAGAAEMSTGGLLRSQSYSWPPMDSKGLFPQFTPSCSRNGKMCPKGQIHSLVLEVFKDNISRAVSPLLPSCVFLRSLHFHSEWAIEEADVLRLMEALKVLFKRPACSLTDLSIGAVSCSMPVCTLLMHLLTACPTLKSLSLEASPVCHQTNICVTPAPQPAVDSGFSLERLSLRFPQVDANLENLTLVLRCASSLTALHLNGIHNGGQELGALLESLPELNPNLTSLSLDDVNLAKCHSEVLNLLKNSKLKDVHFKDCGLLEKCKVKENFLVPFVTALKGVSSLRSLSLSQNRLANGIIALGDLFSGDSPSRIQRLDISSNYILPLGLLEFGSRLEDNPPPPGLTIDLRCNPLDRDPQVTEQALLKLRPHCYLFTDNWNSRTTMADHISVM